MVKRIEEKNRTKVKSSSKKTVIDMIFINLTVWPTLNINTLNITIKYINFQTRCKNKREHAYLKETHCKNKSTHGLILKECRELYYVNTKQKKTMLATLNSDGSEFNARKTIRNKERYYILEMGQFSKKK